LSAYLPEEMSDEDLKTLIREVLANGEFAGKADIGKATGAVMKVLAGRASGDRVREMLQGELEA
jgi:uncharacterized protein